MRQNSYYDDQAVMDDESETILETKLQVERFDEHEGTSTGRLLEFVWSCNFINDIWT